MRPSVPEELVYACGSMEPIEKSLTLPIPPAEAFRRFTDELGAWWPLESHSVAQGTVAFEDGVILERAGDARHRWGEVTAWEPPGRLAFTWHPGRPAETAQTIEARFEAEGEGTRLTLMHGGWERYGDGAERMRAQYGPGWDFVLGRFSTHAAR